MTLDQRGLLEDMLMVWGGKFGRPGLKPGHVHGATHHDGSRVEDGVDGKEQLARSVDFLKWKIAQPWPN